MWRQMKGNKDTSGKLFVIQSMYFYLSGLQIEEVLQIFLVSLVKKIIQYIETDKRANKKYWKSSGKLYRKTVIVARLICCYYRFSMVLMKEVHVRTGNNCCNDRTSNADEASELQKAIWQGFKGFSLLITIILTLKCFA